MQSNSYDRKYEPSPIYPFRNSGSVTTTAPLSINLESNPYGNYQPFTNCRISNKSSVDIFIYPNDDASKKIKVNSSTILDITPTDIPAWRSAKIYTQTGTASANEIEVNFWKAGVTPETLVQSIHRKLFKKTNELIV